ncbi:MULTISPECIES: DUF6286 domain-containing protein [unclassified Streptomyces]|uniref:DUF6286 domain-containing protein n=1 Tax=Streptomyces sp. R33 TaxID=3238629 RepID=A0AB39YCL0_9ACTN|nr:MULTISPECIES: DUF6286 domain-containing protein [unclassified Streptomyces]KOY53876.1 membrane protein [Streptomyces sp. XY332]TDU78907.1 hypothetical protein EDD91_5701 [Streptomyces sp. KS 21]
MTAPAPGRAPAPEPDPAPDRGRPPVRARRFRSARRVPAALTALAVLGVAGLFLYDLAAVRAGRPGMEWRRELAHQLERQTPADPWVLVCAGALAVAGAVLLFLALTPGLRGILPMRTADPDAGVRAGLARKAAALVLRDRAMEVSGVQSARVAVGRSHVAVRAASHFRELDDVRADLEAVLAVGIEELGLAHAPQPRVRVTRAPVGKR